MSNGSIGLPKLFTCCFSLCFLLLPHRSTAQTRPNIIFILTDDIGYEIPTCDGGKSYSTPNIDRMAQDGMLFRQCHASPVCSPSRFSLLTGKYNFRNYLNWGKMGRDQKTIANMMQKAGYATLVSGKWQLDGGDRSAHKFGFDDYSLWKALATSSNYYQYKSPQIYENGDYLPASETNNKYGEDLFAKKVMDFMDSNKTKPFFIYYSMVLCHKGFSPTPDDPEYASWDPGKSRQIRDSIYFPSMVKYMDKKIGEVISKVKSLNLENNTIIIFSGDNGTPPDITSFFGNWLAVKGGKSSTREYGTHVPLIIDWKGKIAPGTVNSDLIDFTDFLPTLANVANIPVPTDFGPLDGVSFAPALTGQPGAPRKWLFNHYKTFPYSSLVRWAQTATYKLYNSPKGVFFYNIVDDILEKKPIPDSLLTSEQLLIKQQLQAVINGYALQSPPFIQSISASDITDTSAVIHAVISKEGGFTSVKTRGTICAVRKEINIKDNPIIDSGTSISAFSQLRPGLLPETRYFYNAFATNDNGVGVGFCQESVLRTLSKRVVTQPTVFKAEPGSGSIRLTWNNAVFPATGASKGGYLLFFSTGTPSLLPMPNGLPPEHAISEGSIVSAITTTLPSLPPVSATRGGLLSNTKYNFLLIPYTWDGTDTSTYNYFTAGAKMVTATTLLPEKMEITVYPNPSSTEFTLVINSPENTNVRIRAIDMNGRNVFQSGGPLNRTYHLGRNFSPGMYLLEVIQGNDIRKAKIIKGK